MTVNIKTMISLIKPIFDVNDKYLPYGNYEYRITQLKENTVVGTLSLDNKWETFELKQFTVIKLMSNSQARLARRADIFGLSVPDQQSPSNTPDLCRYTNIIITNSPKLNKTFRKGRAKSADITHSESPVVKPSAPPPDREICSICLDEIENPEPIECGHIFHDECIEIWMSEGQKTCPVCRSEYNII